MIAVALVGALLLAVAREVFAALAAFRAHICVLAEEQVRIESTNCDLIGTVGERAGHLIEVDDFRLGANAAVVTALARRIIVDVVAVIHRRIIVIELVHLLCGIRRIIARRLLGVNLLLEQIRKVLGILDVVVTRRHLTAANRSIVLPHPLQVTVADERIASEMKLGQLFVALRRRYAQRVLAEMRNLVVLQVDRLQERLLEERVRRNLLDEISLQIKIFEIARQHKGRNLRQVIVVEIEGLQVLRDFVWIFDDVDLVLGDVEELKVFRKVFVVEHLERVLGDVEKDQLGEVLEHVVDVLDGIAVESDRLEKVIRGESLAIDLTDAILRQIHNLKILQVHKVISLKALDLILGQPQAVQILQVGKALEVGEIFDEVFAEIEKLEELKVLDKARHAEEFVVVEMKIHELHRARHQMLFHRINLVKVERQHVETHQRVKREVDVLDEVVRHDERC